MPASKDTSEASLCETFFRVLSENLPTDWEKVATFCGLVSDEIENIKLDNTKVRHRSFQFLVKLRNKFPDLTAWSEKLHKALRKAERNDLVEQLEKFLSKVTQEDAAGEDIPDSEPSSTSSTPRRPPGDMSVLRDLEKEITPHQNLINKNSKPEGTTAKSPKFFMRKEEAKCKRRLPSDDKENAGCSHSSPKTKKVKKEKPTIGPVPPPSGKLKLISEISKADLSGSGYIDINNAWIDYMVMPKGTNKPLMGNGNYYFHCFLRDSSGVSIYTSFFHDKQKECFPIYKKIKASTQAKPLHLCHLRVNKQSSEHLDKPDKSNYRLISNDWSSVMEAYKTSK